MSGRFLLDTSIVIALFAEDTSVEEHLKEAEEVFIPSIVLGELYFGVRKSGRIRQNLKRIDELAISSAVLACDLGTAREYGEIKGTLQEKGRPIIEVW